MTEDPPPRPSGSESSQSQHVQIGHDFRVEGTGHQVDFSQTHIETQIIQQTSVEAVQSRPLITTSPYKGLKKFEATDHQRFFGRESLVADLLRYLAAHRCLILLGASGSGKSSLVRAGIIPKLEEERGTNLIDLTFTPDEDPFDAFYASLLGHFKQADARLARQVDANTLTQVVLQLQSPDTPWVIFVDQFEELFSITQPQKREAFVASLVNLQRLMIQEQHTTGGNGRSLYLILAMRADFLDQFAPYRDLGQLTERYMRFITNMTREDLKRAIANPANLNGVAYQDGLLKEILNDLQDQPGELPLLQYMLDLLWKRANLDNRLICCDAYWTIEGVQGALRQHVNEIYNQLPPADQTHARQIFLSLVDTSVNRDHPEGSSKAVSRRAYISQFTDAETRRVLRYLIDANLLVSNWQPQERDIQGQTAVPDVLADGALSRRATVELAHETLIRSWPLLQNWLEENQEIINLRHRLSDEARQWHELAQKSPAQATDELWRGAKLERVEELRQEGRFEMLFGGLEAAEDEFVDAALTERDRQHHEQEKRRQQELRLYRITGISSVLASGVLVLLAIAVTLGWRAQLREIEALITAADASFSDNRHSSNTLVTALEAGDRLQKSFWFRNDSDLQAKTLQVVSQAVYWVKEQGVLSGHSYTVESVAVSPDESTIDQRIATAGRDGTVRLWTLQGEELQTLMKQEQHFSFVRFSPDGSRLAIADYDGKVTLWSRQDDSLQPLGNGHQQAVREVSFHPTEPRLATVGDDGSVKIWDFNGQQLNSLDEHQAAVDAVAYSPDGRFLVTGGIDQTVILWDSDGNRLQTIENLPSAVLSLDFSQGGQWLTEGDWLAIAMDDGTVQIHPFDPDGAIILEPAITLSGHTAGVTAVQFSPNGTLIATASVDGTAKIWNRFGKEVYALEGHDGRINGLDFNATGTMLATASNDNTVKLWNLNSPAQRILSGHSSTIFSVNFSSDNTLLATASTDDRVLVWDAMTPYDTSPQVLQAGNDVYNVAISPNSQYLAGALEDGTVKLWSLDIDNNNQMEPLIIPAHGDKAVSDVQFSDDSQTLISSGYDAAVRFWRVADGTLQDTLQNDDQNLTGIYALSWHQDINLLATANDNTTVNIWQLETQQLQLIAHEQSVYQALFSPDGQTLVTAGEDATVKLWDLKDELQQEQKLRGHGAGIWGLDISADNQLIASGSDDATAIIWTMKGKHLLQLMGHQEAVNTVSFSSDRRWLATGSADDTVILWNVEDLSLQAFLQQGCDWLTHSQHNLNHKVQQLCPTSLP
ncbi:wd-40 repeat protein [Leptolyngbya sp. Heron Island J]|uniref:nSTAND1 domain-containing NTPase n=1 Tax=Leptolyngbya sp. Heron Island J TaxID=1385935 RepID=UPI0003B96EFD|nr:WD-40 repeat protein [Leptolyngbya sp. Heron Island J]ESA36472.1 wd-40 repeat protein [Leptolyngbya sp. Heron Island J]